MTQTRSSLLFALAGGLAFAQPRPPIPQQLTFTPHHATGIYEVGDSSAGRLPCPGSGNPYLRIQVDCSPEQCGRREGGQARSSSGMDTIEVAGDRPEMIYVAVEPYAELSPADAAPTAAAPVYVGGNAGRNNGLYAVGAAVAPRKLGLSTPRPDDFDTFWDAKVSAQSKIPINAVLTPVPTDVPDVELNTFVLDALASKAHGYVAKPAREGKFPAVIQLQYAGVMPGTRRQSPTAPRRGG